MCHLCSPTRDWLIASLALHSGFLTTREVPSPGFLSRIFTELQLTCSKTPLQAAMLSHWLPKSVQSRFLAPWVRFAWCWASICTLGMKVYLAGLCASPLPRGLLSGGTTCLSASFGQLLTSFLSSVCLLCPFVKATTEFLTQVFVDCCVSMKEHKCLTLGKAYRRLFKKLPSCFAKWLHCPLPSSI